MCVSVRGQNISAVVTPIGVNVCTTVDDLSSGQVFFPFCGDIFRGHQIGGQNVFGQFFFDVASLACVVNNCTRMRAWPCYSSVDIQHMQPYIALPFSSYFNLLLQFIYFCQTKYLIYCLWCLQSRRLTCDKLRRSRIAIFIHPPSFGVAFNFNSLYSRLHRGIQ